MYMHKCHISVLFVYSYFLHINAGRYLLVRPPTETTHQSPATKARFSHDTLRRGRQTKAHVRRAAGINFARLGGFHLSVPFVQPSSFLGKGTFACVGCCCCYRLSIGRGEGCVQSQKLNKFMKFSAIIYLSPEERASMPLQVGGTHVPEYTAP
jgi:hypothetical protein